MAPGAISNTQRIEELRSKVPAFYFEFAPPPGRTTDIDHLYVLRDCGKITAAGQAVFASPYWSLRFVFRDSKGQSPLITVASPRFGHHIRRQPFHGWVIGARSRQPCFPAAAASQPAFKDYAEKLSQAVAEGSPIHRMLDILDELLDSTHQTERSNQRVSGKTVAFFKLSQAGRNITKLASMLGQSSRTLQRRIRASSGFSPKQMVAVQRFDDAVRTIPAHGARLSHVAGDLHFSDQPHLTREFRRHAGLSPGAFRDMWQESTVRFVQDHPSVGRLRMAMWVTVGGEKLTARA